MLWKSGQRCSLGHGLGNVDGAPSIFSAGLPPSAFSSAMASQYLASLLSSPLAPWFVHVTCDLDINCVLTKAYHSTPPMHAQTF